MTAPRRPQWAASYNAGEFPPFAYAADILVFSVDPRAQAPADSLRGLFVTRVKDGPYRGYRAWAGGFVDWATDQDARAAAIRELREETGLERPAFIEPLDTYDANGRDPRQFAGKGSKRGAARVVSKAFIVLHGDIGAHLMAGAGEDADEPRFDRIYPHLPWEEEITSHGRAARRSVINALLTWTGADDAWVTRIRAAFGLDDGWNEERAGERFRLMLRAGLVEEAHRDRWGQALPGWRSELLDGGTPLAFDHRMMLADALSRLRGKIKYVPGALKSMMPERFTMTDLHQCVSALSGREIQKGNFWRMFGRHRMQGILVAAGGHSVPENRRYSEDRRGPDAQIYSFARDVETLRFDPAVSFPFTRKHLG